MIFKLTRSSPRSLQCAAFDRKSLPTLHLRRAPAGASRLWHGPCLSACRQHDGGPEQRRGKGGPMKASLLGATVVTMVLALGGAAQAQTYFAPAVASGAYGYPGGYGYGYGYHSSTLEEGSLRGLGALTASQG